jgi:hypothetical protein
VAIIGETAVVRCAPCYVAVAPAVRQRTLHYTMVCTLRVYSSVPGPYVPPEPFDRVLDSSHLACSSSRPPTRDYGRDARMPYIFGESGAERVGSCL